jgi:hypothetical protein
MVEAQLVTGIASEGEGSVWAAPFCVQQLKRLRYERERAAVRREIEELQKQGAGHGVEINALLARNGELGRLIQALVMSED